MKKSIIALIEKSNFDHFRFQAGQSDPIKHLKHASISVPEVDGVYFVFTRRNSQTDLNEHLSFDFTNQKLTLVYFGIAGGIAKSGKTSSQKLRKRINNVVGSSSIKRARYWDDFMIGNDTE